MLSRVVIAFLPKSKYLLISWLHHFADKGPYSQSYSFYSSHVWMWELDHKEVWAPNNWCFWTVMLERTLEIPLDCKEIKPVNPKGNQSRISIGRTDAKAEAPILWPPDSKSRLIRKDPDAGRDWRQEEKGTMRRGWDGWMASPTQWTWVWVDSGSWWWTGRPGVLRFIWSQSRTRLTDWTDWLLRTEIINRVLWGKPANLAYSR